MATSPLLHIETPSKAPPPSGAAWLALGFRPFYLAASVLASVSMLLWIGDYSGVLPSVFGRNPVLHAHEMVFGFAVAVIVGFLFTAGRNWSNHPTPTGALLGALLAVWLAGRILVFTRWPLASAIVNAAFPVLAGVALAVPFVRSGNRRNYFFVALLVLIGGAELAVNLSNAGLVRLPPGPSLQVALDVVLIIMVVMGGRVIPMFTNNAVPSAGAQRIGWLEKSAIGSVAAIAVADAFQLPAALTAAVLAIAAIVHGTRLWLWHPWRTLRAPLVWILHAGYAWIVAHLLLRAIAHGQAIPPTLAVHALTIGAIGSLTIGMMTRTARGHTGRPLTAGGAEVAAYALVQAAAIARVIGGWAVPSLYVATVVVAGLCWAAAFAVYAVAYWPMLTKPRLDGRPG